MTDQTEALRAAALATVKQLDIMLERQTLTGAVTARLWLLEALATPPAEGLDAAWARVETALPEGWNWEDVTRLTGDSEGEWAACARNDTGEGRYRWCGTGPTPADALNALADKLAEDR